MTNPEDPYGYSPFTYDPLGRAPYVDLPVGPPPFVPPPASPHRRAVNVFATLSLMFAFVFPPAGAILGHLGLAQIRRTGEPGRDRAVAGLTLSYAFITLTVLALVAWAALAAVTSPSTPTAAPATMSTTSTGPPPPTVAPDSVAALLPSLTDLRNIVGDQNLEAGQTRNHAGRSDDEGSIDHPECWGSIAPGVPDAYTGDAIAGYHAAKFADTRTFFKSVEVVQTVIAFRDVPTAQSQLAQVLSGWRHCGGSTVLVTIRDVGPVPYSLGKPVDAGNSITTMDLAPKGLQIRSVRAIAAKANVIIDLAVTNGGATDPVQSRGSAVSITNYILNKIPG